MENFEIVNVEGTEMDDVITVAEEGSGMGTGVAMLIGAGLAVAVGAAVKLGKKVVKTVKAKRELRRPDKEIEVTDEDCEMISSK